MVESEEQRLRRELDSVRVRRAQLAERNRQLRDNFMTGKRRQLATPVAVLGASAAGAMTYTMWARRAERPKAPLSGYLGRMVIQEIRVMLLGLLLHR